MKKIITPQLYGSQPNFETYKDNNSGEMVIRVHDKAIKLSPRQSCDLGIVLLQSQGVDTAAVEKAVEAAMGTALKAGLKMIF
jgi:hypothetical protein